MKKIKLVFAILSTSILMSLTSFAGEWKQDATGWWYQNDDGSYPVNVWQWIDGDNDETAECYYFDAQGYCLMNTTTPDNCSVDNNGAWIIDGVVQKQTISIPVNQTSNASKSNDSIVSETNVVWLSKTGEKYHINPGCGNMKNPIESTLKDAISAGRTPCSKCVQ